MQSARKPSRSLILTSPRVCVRLGVKYYVGKSSRWARVGESGGGGRRECASVKAWERRSCRVP